MSPSITDAPMASKPLLWRIALTLVCTALMLLGLAVAQPPKAAAAGPGPFYYIVAEHSGKPIMPINHTKDHGAAIVQADWQGGGALHWKIRRSGTIDGQERIRRFENRHSKYCVSANQWYTPVGLVQTQCTSFHTMSEEWVVSSASDMWAGRPFSVWNRQSGHCMDVAGASTAAYTRVWQWYCNGQPNQKFRLVYVQGT